MRQQKTTESISSLAVAQGNMDFFHYLQERPVRRFSRFEAYIYMLDKACSHYRPQGIDPKWVPAIGDGQFFTTKTELASDWQWHRATVRDYLDKLKGFGQLVVEEHLKGILCTLPHLIIPATPGIAVVYNFDSMAKYAMYSWADGRLKPHQVACIAGQIERSANVMLYGDTLSPYSEKQLEDTTRMMLHYAVEAVIARRPGEMKAAKEICGCTSVFEKRLQEFFREHLGGSWVALLTLLYRKTEVALDALVEASQLGVSSRAAVYERLLQETSKLFGGHLDSHMPVASRADESGGSGGSGPDASSSEGGPAVPESLEPASKGSLP